MARNEEKIRRRQGGDIGCMVGGNKAWPCWILMIFLFHLNISPISVTSATALKLAWETPCCTPYPALFPHPFKTLSLHSKLSNVVFLEIWYIAERGGHAVSRSDVGRGLTDRSSLLLLLQLAETVQTRLFTGLGMIYLLIP
jgi:hypothetical protein